MQEDIDNLNGEFDGILSTITEVQERIDKGERIWGYAEQVAWDYAELAAGTTKAITEAPPTGFGCIIDKILVYTSTDAGTTGSFDWQIAYGLSSLGYTVGAGTIQFVPSTGRVAIINLGNDGGAGAVTGDTSMVVASYDTQRVYFVPQGVLSGGSTTIMKLTCIYKFVKHSF